MVAWLFTRKGLWIGALMVLAVVAGLVLLHLMTGFFDRAANGASVIGLAVSVMGFGITLWTVYETKRANEEAQRRIQDAVEQGREETRQVVAGIAKQLLASDCAALRFGLQDLRQASQDTDWHRAVYRCQELRPVVLRLAEDRQLSAEADALRAIATDLAEIQRLVEGRLPASTTRLQPKQIQRLNDAIDLLTIIQARLHHASLAAGSTEARESGDV